MSDGGLTIPRRRWSGPRRRHTGDIRTGETYASDQSSQIEVTSTQLTGGQWIGAAVRAQNGGQNLYLGIYFWNNGSPELMLFKRISGNWTQLGAHLHQRAAGGRHPAEAQAVGSTLSLLAKRRRADHGHRHQPDRRRAGHHGLRHRPGRQLGRRDTDPRAATYTVGGTVSGPVRNRGPREQRRRRPEPSAPTARSPSHRRWPPAPPTTSPSRPTLPGRPAPSPTPRHHRLGQRHQRPVTCTTSGARSRSSTRAPTPTTSNTSLHLPRRRVRHPDVAGPCPDTPGGGRRAQFPLCASRRAGSGDHIR